MKNGPFTIKERKQVYKNPWIEVTEDKVLHDNGKSGLFGTVKMKPGVSILVIEEEGNAYLTDEFHYVIGKNSLEVVSGGIDGDENPLAAAKRELKEELGIEADEWVELGVVDPFTTLINSPAYLFLARKPRFVEKHEDDFENIKLVKMKFKDVVKMVMESKITHGPSCAAILKANEFLRQ